MVLVGAICMGIALSSVVYIMQLATGAGALQFSDSIRPTPATLAKLMPVTFTTNENTPNLTVIGRLVDSIRPKPNQNLRYTIPQNPYFDISPESSVRVIGLLDRDENRQLCTEPSYPQQCVWTSFVVTGNGQYIGLRVVINDVNDNVPAWAESSITIHVTEEMQTTFSAELPVAKDPDLDKNGIQGYKLQTELEDAERFELIVKSSAVKSGFRFSIDSAETLSSRFKLFLQVLKPLDRETQPRHNLTLLAFDGSEPYHTGRLNIIVEVVDENDHSPQFTSSAYTAVVSEDASVGSDIPLQESISVAVKQSDSGGFVPPGYVDRVSQLRATDRDVGPNGQIQYEFAASTDPQVLDLFTLDQYSGRICVAKPLSYDIRPTGWKFQVLAKDGGRPARSSSTTVVIQLKDANTHGPEIKTRLHEPKPFVEGITRLGKPSAPSEHITNVIYIPENTPPVLEPLAVFTVGDKDTGTGGEFDCVLTDSETSASDHADGSADFRLNFTAKLPNWNVYSLYVIRSIDREAAPVRELVVTCTDHGEPPRSTYEKLNVILVDENDNAPQFIQKTYQFHVLEGNRPNASVGKLRAHDPDDGPNGRVTYRIVWPPTQPISDRPFLIAKEGKLIVTKTLDRESNPKGYKFQVIAADGGKPRPLNDTAEVEVILDDINDCTPQFSQKHYNFTVEEDYAQNFTIGRFVGRVQAVDCDLGLNGAVQYVILDPGLPFEVSD
ncbi:Protocadherin alpha-11 [Fasciola gigantica]|uniref:Protocadherin alpha-11 n=1 Tax=Fasciola gigantica TaxID=46835 RepID=A0A504YZ47_FASGI|nr:Protocadherin alpha-11 [Fasciola gigantica]